MEGTLSFLAAHSGTIIAVLALLLAMQANVISRKVKADSDRILLSERRRDLLREIDKQQVTMHRLRFILESQIIQFEQCHHLEKLQPSELERLNSNLKTLEKLERFCLETRRKIERADVHDDPAELDAKFAEVGRLTAHLEKDVEHEKSLLEDKKNLVKTAPKERHENEHQV